MSVCVLARASLQCKTMIVLFDIYFECQRWKMFTVLQFKTNRRTESKNVKVLMLFRQDTSLSVIWVDVYCSLQFIISRKASYLVTLEGMRSSEGSSAVTLLCILLRCLYYIVLMINIEKQDSVINRTNVYTAPSWLTHP